MTKSRLCEIAEIAAVQQALRAVAIQVDMVDSITGFTGTPSPRVMRALEGISNRMVVRDEDLAELLRHIASHWEE